MAIHYAHLVMLAETGIVSREDAHRIREALDAVSLDEVRDVRFDGTCEDLFFYVEGLLVASCGEDVAGRLHTARSRNDIDMTMYRMRQREFVLELVDGGARAAREPARSRVAAPRHGHGGAHAHAAGAADDDRALPAGDDRAARTRHHAPARRLSRRRTAIRSARARSPAPGFRSTASLTSELLGFDGPTGNTYGSIATVDYLLESTYATAITLGGLGRFVQDLLLWGTAEVNYVRFGDGFVQSSSIMPQKRNPVAIEHARAIGSKAVGQAQAIGAGGPQHAVRRHRRHRGRSAAARVVDVPGRDARRAAGRRGDADGHLRRGAARGARRARRDDDDRAGGHAGARARDAVQDRARDRRARAEGARARTRTARLTRDARRGMLRAGRPADSLHARSGCTRS